jgi:hypothetical protein
MGYFARYAGSIGPGIATYGGGSGQRCYFLADRSSGRGPLDYPRFTRIAPEA